MYVIYFFGKTIRLFNECFCDEQMRNNEKDGADDKHGKDKKSNQKFSFKTWKQIGYLSVIVKRDCKGVCWIKLAQGKVLCLVYE